MSYKSRIFLNKKEGIAAMETSLSIAHYLSCTVTISDCNRNVSLDFSSYTIKQFDERLVKLHRIISELAVLEDRLRACKMSPEFKKAFK
jgi:hypothetical protein